MLLPIGDEPNSPETPWATYALMAINVFVWVVLCLPLVHQPLRFSTPGALDYIDVMRKEMHIDRLDMLGRSSLFDLFLFQHGYRPAQPQVLALLTSMFLHGGWLHLAGNMLSLYIFGDNVEARLGWWRYLLAYLGTGIVATLTYAAMRQGSPFPLVGASGAISGILGCYFVWFPRNRVQILYSLFFFIERARVPARWVLLGYLVIDNILPMLLPHGASHSGIAHGAHLGGFVAGAVFAYYVASSPHASPAQASARTRSAGGAFSSVQDVFERSQSRRDFQAAARRDDIVRLIGKQQFAEAVAMYRAMPAKERLQLDAESMFALADALTVEKRYDEALQLLRPFCGPKQPSQDVRARAHLRMGLVYLRGLTHAASAYPHLLDALALGADTPVAEAAHAALQEIEQPKRDPWARR